MDIYLWSDGQQQGPYPLESILQWLRSGSIPAEAPAWAEGQGEWQSLAQLLPQLGHAVPVAAAAPRPATHAPGRRPGPGQLAAKRPQTVITSAPTSATPTGTKTVSIQGTIKRGMAADLQERETGSITAHVDLVAPAPLPLQPVVPASSGTGKRVGLIVGGVLLLAALGAGAFLFLNREKPEAKAPARAGVKEVESVVTQFAAGHRDRLPNTVQGLDIIRGLGIQDICRYEATGATTYRVTFTGPDGRFQTSDDEVHELELPKKQ